jgi:hypothetical protein
LSVSLAKPENGTGVVVLEASGVHAVDAVAIGVGAPQATVLEAFQLHPPVPGTIPSIHGTTCTS